MDNDTTKMSEATPIKHEAFIIKPDTSTVRNRHHLPTTLLTLFLVIIIPATLWAVSTNRIEIRNWAANTTLCWSAVIEQNGNLYWPNGCKGSPPTNRSVCTEALVALTAQEQLRYRQWVSGGRQTIPGCEANSVALPPLPTISPGCFQKPVRCIAPPCDPIIVCPPFDVTMTPDPGPTCIPLPKCMEEKNPLTRCAIMLPPGGTFCPPTNMLSITPSDDVAMTPDPGPTCIPRPKCIDNPDEGQPYCDPYIPPGGQLCPEYTLATPTPRLASSVTPTKTPTLTPSPITSPSPTTIVVATPTEYLFVQHVPSFPSITPPSPTVAPKKTTPTVQTRRNPFSELRELFRSLFPFLFQ